MTTNVEEFNITFLQNYYTLDYYYLLFLLSLLLLQRNIILLLSKSYIEPTGATVTLYNYYYYNTPYLTIYTL